MPLWGWRNKETRDKEYHHPSKIWLLVKNLAQYYMHVKNNSYVVQQVHKQEVLVRWKPSVLDWVKINTDGASKDIDSDEWWFY